MAKFKVEMYVGEVPSVNVIWFESYEEYEKELEPYDEDNERYVDEEDPLCEFVVLAMHQKEFESNDSFCLKVTDKQGNVVYETNDPKSITLYPHYNEETGEYEEIPNFKKPKLPEGYYIIKEVMCHGLCVTAEIETDEFDPSKLSIYPCRDHVDSLLRGEKVCVNELRYDNIELDACTETSWIEGYSVWDVGTEVDDSTGEVEFEGGINIEDFGD